MKKTKPKPNWLFEKAFKEFGNDAPFVLALFVFYGGAIGVPGVFWVLSMVLGND